MSLGCQLREARLTANLTIATVAERSGFSPSYISQVERDLANPSIGAVNRIASAIGVRMSAFFAAEFISEDEVRPAAVGRSPTGVVLHNRRKRLTYPGSEVTFELLCPDLQRSMEVLFSRSPVGTESGDTPITHLGEECGIVLKGTFELTVGDETFTLQAGDAIYFDSSKPHSWKSLGPDDAEAIWVITPPHF